MKPEDAEELPRFEKRKSRRVLRAQREGSEGFKDGTVWRMCRKKRSYHTQKLAQRVIAKVITERGVETLRPYFCPICRGYHITKTENKAPTK